MRIACLAAVCILVGVVAGVESVAATEVPVFVSQWSEASSVSLESVSTLAQYDSDSQSSSGSTRFEHSGKLIGLVIAGIIGLFSFVVKLFRGND